MTNILVADLEYWQILLWSLRGAVKNPRLCVKVTFQVGYKTSLLWFLQLLSVSLGRLSELLGSLFAYLFIFTYSVLIL